MRVFEKSNGLNLAMGAAPHAFGSFVNEDGALLLGVRPGLEEWEVMCVFRGKKSEGPEFS